MISIFLLGALTIQVYIYYHKFTSDSRKLKLLVATVWLLELGHAICSCDGLYTYTILRYGQPEDMIVAVSPISLKASLVFSAPVAPLVQVFFAYRVRRFSGKPYIAIFCWVLSLWRFACGIWAAVSALRGVNLIMYDPNYRSLIMMGAFCGAAVDFTISASMCYFLATYRGAVLKRTIRVIDKLVAWTIETGLITSITSIVVGVTFLTMPDNLVWISILIFVDRLYSNSLLALDKVECS